MSLSILGALHLLSSRVGLGRRLMDGDPLAWSLFGGMLVIVTGITIYQNRRRSK